LILLSLVATFKITVRLALAKDFFDKEVHPMGEKEFDDNVMVQAISNTSQAVDKAASEISISTPGGRYQVCWDAGGSATALGQLPVFAEYLEATGIVDSWLEGCPKSYTSPEAVDVLGTWLLSILDGQRRYAHVAGLRGDEVAPLILGMNRIISDESLRRALAHLAPTEKKRCSDTERAGREAQLVKSTAWMDASLDESTREALRTPWILDIDTTVKFCMGIRQVPRLATIPPNRGDQVIA